MARRKRNRKGSTPTTPKRALSTASFVRRAREAIVALVPVVAIVLFTRVALAEAYHIPSGSMEPTILVGDWLWVNKLRLGAHIPFTHTHLPGYAEARRNDIVVFESPPQDPAIRITPTDVTPTLVKRIVGVAGDTLVMRHGELRVNGEIVPARNTAFVLADSIADEPQALFAWQRGIAIANSRFGAPPAAPSLHEWGPLVVPAGTFFMMGDNRDDSVDSRYYGPVPRANLRGTTTFVYYSYDTTEGLDYFRALTEIRWSRLGTWIR